MENKSVRTAPAIVLLAMALFYHTGESATPAQPIRITGKVVEGREPFAGARVELYPAAPIYKDALRQLAGEPPVPLKSTRTGPDGTYELLAPESGAYRVVVQAKDRLGMEHLAVPVVDEVSLPPAELTRPSTIAIQALGPDGRPLAGLPLRVAQSLDNVPWRQFGWQPAERRGVTGPDGKLALPRRKHEPLNVYVTDPLYLGLAASEVSGDSVTVRPKLSPEPTAGRPARPGTVTGKVVDARTGKPIAGALVWSGLPPDLPPVRTAEDGTFSLPVLAAGKSFGVAAPGYEMSEPQPASPGKRVAVALKRTAAIRGQVVDKAGAPIAGAVIEIRPGPAWNRGSSLYMSHLFSRADGSFSFHGLLPGGAYRLVAHRRGYGRSEVEVKTSPAGQPTPARIVLGSGTTVTGRVVDEGGNPIEGAEILMTDVEIPDPGGLVQTTSEATGAFTIPHLIPGSFQIFARRAGHAPASRAGVVVPEGDTRVDVGEIVLKGGSAIEGRVTDASGRAVEGAEVRTYSDQGLIDPRKAFAEEEPPPDARSGPDGLFRIEDLERGRRYTVTVWHPAHPREAVPDVEAPTADPVLIELQPARTLSGRVVGPEGEPVPDAEITAVLTFGLGGRSHLPLARTDSAGEFQGSDLKPGLLDLQVTARGYRETWWKGVQVPQDRDPEPVTITMERGSVLEIRARDREGNPLSDVRVLVWPTNPPERAWPRHPFGRPITDGDGLARFDDLAPGEYTVSGMTSGRSAEANVRLGSGTTRVDLLFEHGIAVAGRVVNEEGEPVPFATVHAAEGEGMTARGVSSQADGSFVIPDLEEGEYRLTASAKGYGKSEPQRLRLGGSGVEGLEFRLSREAVGAISGRVLGLPPEALSRVQVEAGDPVGWDSATSPVDEQGRYRLSSLRSGRWTVRAFQPNGRIVQEEVVLEPGAEAVLDLQFPEGLTFSGRVALDGRPLRGAQIAATSLENQGFHAMSRADYEGRFSLGPLQPGRHSILIHRAESALGTYRIVQLQEGQEIRLEIQTGGIQGHILSENGEPVPDAAVQFRIMDPATGQALPDLGPTVRSDAQGAFEMLSIPTGLYTVAVKKPGYKETQLRVEVRPGVAVQDILLKAAE
ncbi:MAG TPA: carboxypeptidase regulatory-like domain-containing protein [Thermoanaerobaculia bacterium]|nr:carboxypeptidase regulatory-like domain-containing protein [Thermoanaerobaculia bacterium]